MSKNQPRVTPPKWVSWYYFLTAFAWLVIFCLGLPWISRLFGTDQFQVPAVIGWVHVLTIGVLSQIMIGAWYHLMFMITGSRAPRAGRILFHYIGLNLGLAWFLGSWLSGELTWNLTLAATVLAVIFTDISVMSLIRLFTGTQGKRYKKYIATGYLSFLIIGWLGFTMAHNKWLGFLGFSRFLEWIETHALIGVGGWFGMMAIGISYKLIPFFLREDPKAIRGSGTVFIALLLGITTWIAGLWTDVGTGRLIGQVMVLSGMGIWFWQMSLVWYRNADTKWAASFTWIFFGIGYGLTGLVVLLLGHSVGRLLAGGMLVFMSVLCFELGFLHRILPFLKTVFDNPLKMRDADHVPSVETNHGLRGLFTNLTHVGIGGGGLAILFQSRAGLTLAVVCFSTGIIATVLLLGWSFTRRG